MSTESTMEQRLAVVEKRLAAIEAALMQLPNPLPSRKPAPNWLERVIGSMKDEPAFLEVLEYGRAYRQSDRPSEDDEA